ncbi:MAG: glutamine--fructose-6-phosphate aminotransferase [Acidobacteria bacterium]|nr:MAG: glutamine--fructose-6-phosphate aminotransferase [Acidobacteriota bacterium]
MSRMLEEIREQPAALERTLKAELRRAERFKKFLEMRRPRLVILAARGTSDNAALFGRYLLEITTGIPVSLAAPSIYTLYNARVDLQDTLVAAVSQSGESTDTNIVLSEARKRGAMTIGITNETSSSLAKLAEHVFLVRAGKERSVAATKTFTGQVLMLYLLAYALGGKVRPDDLARLPERVEMALTLEPHIAALSERYRFMDHAVVVGRGLNYANAFEFALKMMETCYVVAERFSSADFLHGPIALVDRDFPVFAFAPTGVTWPAIRETVQKLHGLKAEAVLITDAGNREARFAGSRLIQLPRRLPELHTPIPFIIPAQIFTACLADQKGINPDHPRTITKVTKNL